VEGQKGATSLSVATRWRSASRHFSFEVHLRHLRRRRKAQFGAWIDHSVQVDAKLFNERPELGFSGMPAHYRFIAKLAVACHRS
jgi:hypothetical protein